MFEPGASVTDLFHDVVPDAVCQLSDPTFTSTLLTSKLSEAVPLTVMLVVLNICPLAGYEIVTFGGIVSIVIYPMLISSILLHSLHPHSLHAITR